MTRWFLKGKRPGANKSATPVWWARRRVTNVIIRVRVKIEVRDASTYWLGCKAYAVCNPDQPVFSTSTALLNFQSGPYQKLLDNVKGTLQRPAVTPLSLETAKQTGRSRIGSGPGD